MNKIGKQEHNENSKTKTFLEWALYYASLGWHVFPIEPRRKTPLTYAKKLNGEFILDNSGEKIAIAPNGHLNATLDTKTLIKWWTLCPDAGIGIAMKPSGIVCFDINVANGKMGLESLEEFERTNELECTLSSTTGSGGFHFFYRRPDGVQAKNKIAFMPGIDIIGNGYAIAAPSLHESGGVYTWNDIEQGITELPACLGDVLKVDKVKNEYSASADGTVVHEGGRNNALTSIAGAMKRKGISFAAIESALQIENQMKCNPPLPDYEIEKIVESVSKYDAEDDIYGTVKFAQELGLMTADNANEEPEFYGRNALEFMGDGETEDDGSSWIIPGILANCEPQIIAGPPKSCKSFIALDIAICLAGNISWLKRFEAVQRKVLYFALEDSIHETRRRAWRLARSHGVAPSILADNLEIEGFTSFNFSNPEHIKKLERTIEEKSPQVIFIDSLSRIHNGNENSSDEMRVVTSNWTRICREFGVSIVIIHHFNKAGTGRLINKLRGSSDLPATVRHIIGIDKDGEKSELEFDGNLHPILDPIFVTLKDGQDCSGNPTISVEEANAPICDKNAELDKVLFEIIGDAGVAGVTLNQLRNANKPGSNKGWGQEAIKASYERLSLIGKIHRGEGMRFRVITPGAKQPANDGQKEQVDDKKIRLMGSVNWFAVLFWRFCKMRSLLAPRTNLISILPEQHKSLVSQIRRFDAGLRRIKSKDIKLGERIELKLLNCIAF